jgi:hypothetical protein
MRQRITARQIAETLNRAFDERSMTMPILLAEVIPALEEFDAGPLGEDRDLGELRLLLC